jgi:NitT/TauT family transport system substrate-binding protein
MIFAVIAALIVLVGTAYVLWLRPPKGYSGKVESITIGTTTSEVNLLVVIAQDQGHFAGNGLNVTHRIYSSGLAAAERMLNQEIDMATGSEFAFAGNVLSQKKIRTIGIICRASTEYLVGRMDKGIKSIRDIKGKRIGVPLKSRPEFSLNRFLNLRGIDASAVTLVNVPVNQSVDALMSGEVDVITAWQPYISQVRDRMGDRLVVWSIQESQPSYTVVMCRDQWTVEHPELIKRFLKSLVQAESFNASYPEAAKAFIRKKLNYSEAYVAAAWPDYHFSVSLDQSLVVAMEDQARWMIRNKFTSGKVVPDFLNYVYIDGLKAVKPDAVNIIR